MARSPRPPDRRFRDIIRARSNRGGHVATTSPDVAAWAPSAPSDPYAGRPPEGLYDLLFADDGRRLAKPLDEQLPDSPTAADLARVANDASVESRLRAVAFRRLRHAGGDAPQTPLPLLGVIVEIGLDAGLDVLAAYADHRVRYLNHAGRVAVIEDQALLAEEVDALLEAARPVVAAIGPWDGERRPAPTAGVLRLSFLVGDDLYFGEGPVEALANDAMAGPVFGAATRLLVRITSLPVAREDLL
jgi:hypothetical protein